MASTAPTNTVKSSLFTHVHSSPFSLAARLHQCHANCCHYINSGWTFSGQTSCINLFLSIHTHTMQILSFLFLCRTLINTACKSMIILTVVNFHEEKKQDHGKERGWYFTYGGQKCLSEEVALQQTPSRIATAM